MKRSPLKDKPLRQAGQSVQDQLNNLIDDTVAPYIWAPIIFVAFTVYGWYLWITKTIPNPLLLTVITVAVVIYSVFKVSRAQKEIANLKQGRDGERVVGRLLDSLQGNNCFVLHDIVADGFNLDHVVVSEKGVFAIETKTYSKPPGDSQVRFDG